MNPQEVQEYSQEMLPPDQGAMTLKEFLESDLEGYEYIKGELIPMPPTSIEHGNISSNIQWYLQSHVRTNELGRVYTSDTGFRVGERVLMPDVAFIPTSKLPDDQRAIFSIPPELAIEVISPTDSLTKVVEKALAYLEAGTLLVWIIEPTGKTVTVFRSETDITTLTRKDTLTGEDVVEGFSCPVAQLFE
ncbi:MAG: Uma2 family endonuclease [Candidatus Poribacteria bacterium]|nr:Uma2 family endonuclease [Candidatus Poribacteria bacterium]